MLYHCVLDEHHVAAPTCDSNESCLQDSVKVLAKSLVRNRQYVTKMHGMKANLQAVSLKITVRQTCAAAVHTHKHSSTASLLRAGAWCGHACAFCCR